nr:phosphoribosylformylglycinamidine cyclo-ligase [Nitrospirales bacterium]
VLIGVASTGLHSNGYSLARRVLLDDGKLTVDSRLTDLDLPLGEVLLTPTRIYAKQILALTSELAIKGIAHITGGGLTENLPRIFPAQCRARIQRQTWPIPTIFTVLAKMGGIEREEMYRVFNMGIGLVVIVAPHLADAAIAKLAALGDKGYVIGEMAVEESGHPLVEYVGTDGHE